MQFGALGDIHGDFQSARHVMERHPEVPFWVCVGDVADADGHYDGLPAPLYWIKGNNEDFDLIELAGHEARPDKVELTARKAEPRGEAGRDAWPHSAANLFYIPNGHLIEMPWRPTVAGPVRHLRLAGLGGTFAPTWYEMGAAALPHPKKGTAKATELADKRRHFVREEVEACAAMRGVDLFMTHEAPRPYRIGRLDAGKTPVNEVLASMKPRLHLFGHHHRLSEQERDGVRSVGLDLVSRSYLLIDAESMGYDIKTL